MTKCLNLLGALLASPLVAAAGPTNDDWPQFQGPHRNSRVDVTGLDFTWPEGGPKVLWEVDTIGRGYGGPSVRDGQVFLLDREVGERDVLRAFDFDTGEELWRQPYDAPGRLNFPGSRTVPTISDGLVYTCGGLGHVTCFDRQSGEIVWTVDLTEQYGGRMPSFGWSASPLLVGDKVIAAPLGEEVGLVALDRETGEEVWVTPGIGHSHSTPALLELLGDPQVLFLSNDDQASGTDAASPMTISSFDPEFGTLNWQKEIELTRLPIPGPVQVDEDRFFVTGGYRGGSTMLQISRGEGSYEVEELFHIERGAQIHVPLLHGEHIYVIVNENWNNSRARRGEGGLLCLDHGGNEVWRTGADPFFGRGNSLLVGDHILIQDGFDGTLRVARATPEGYRQVAEANLFGIDDRSDHELWAPMAYANGRLLIRSHEKLLCVQL